ncbi:glycosyl transferase family protein [Agrobacterium tumefaciens]|uniref:glycosyl transferase family protein n=1 Tax=Agrobacterium tumefaciens TaxID=358 RepID=UPI00122FF654|nr:glycosyl transferase family protein [Agrobacterium tumefaciens]
MTTGKRKEEPASPTKPDRLGQLKLLVAFDALLREGSVSRAAAGMGLPTSSMSRILQQLREKYGDQLFLRTGQGLRPTPFAETMRLRIRSLAAEAENLIDYSQEKAAAPAANVSGWERPVLMKAPPLSLRPSVLLEGQPTPENIADRLARIGHNADPQHRLAKYIATSAMGIGNSRPLSQQEAMDALSIILEGDADPIQIGALLATMQYRGVTAAELAGFIEAMWGHIKRDQQAPASVDLDWPAYMSPKHRDAPWFLHSARLVSMAGYSVLLHGHVGQGENGGKLELAAEACGIPLCHSLSQAAKATASQGIAYLPIGGLSLQFQSLLGLHGILEMRLPLNTVVHLLNPLRARSTIIGVARPSYQELHRDTARLLSVESLAILGNTRDFAQFTPFRSTRIFGLSRGKDVEFVIPARETPPAEMPTMFTTFEYWRAVWTGAARDERAETIIVSTAAIALMLVNDMVLPFEEAYARSLRLWNDRARDFATA